MNERKFLKAINSKHNNDGSFTYDIVCNLLEENSKDVVPQKPNILKQFFSKQKTVKSTQQILSDNFEMILTNIHNHYVSYLIEKLSKEPEMQSIIIDNLEAICSKMTSDEITETQIREIFEAIRGIPKGNELIAEKLDKILEYTSIQHLFDTAQSLKGISQEVDDRLNSELEKNKVEVARFLLRNCTATREMQSDTKDQSIEKYAETLSIIIDELLRSENNRFIDMKLLGNGSHSTTYQIGDKVLKIGRPRETYNIPNHNRILQPLIRTNFIDEKNNNEVLACIEISNKVDKIPKDDMQEEELYEVYKELRESGIIWTDVRFDNVGRLTKPNEPSLNGENVDVSPDAVGFDGKLKGKKLSRGELVILDTDCIYDKEATNIVWYIGFANKFERRYQQEVANKIACEHANKSTIVPENDRTLDEH